MRYPVGASIGRVRDYTGGRPSAIAKVQIDGELMLTELGLTEDEQAETKIHGGPNRTLCHCSREHYQHWRQMLPEQVELSIAPAFGGNLSTEGLTEDNVYIGDIFQWEEALIQVTQPHSPCFKPNLHFGISDMASQVQDAGKTGWLCSVITPGQVSVDMPLIPMSRVNDVSVREATVIVWHIPFSDS